MTKADYEKLLKQIQDKISEKKTDVVERFELPSPNVMWEGQRTILHNFMDFVKKLRRDPDKVLQYLAKEFATPAERSADKAIFVGRREPHDFVNLLNIYVKDYLECPTCKSPDTKIERENRITFLICEACGAKSSLKGKYA
ncbi:MAG: translation initiation factor IF-2 subunit beta [Thaumarchaeota archaeon]|nr:translation initiation factor IF-2 subunit beta [Nitrososphaerota archaeon]